MLKVRARVLKRKMMGGFEWHGFVEGEARERERLIARFLFFRDNAGEKATPGILICALQENAGRGRWRKRYPSSTNKLMRTCFLPLLHAVVREKYGGGKNVYTQKRR
jgi:hypothetical protein